MVEQSTPSGRKLVSKTGAVSKISTLRERLGMTQQQLAVFVGVTTNTIQNWEKGTSGVDQIEKFLKLCAVLDCELQDLIEYPEPQPSAAKGFSVEELRELRKKWLGDDAGNDVREDVGEDVGEDAIANPSKRAPNAARRRDKRSQR